MIKNNIEKVNERIKAACSDARIDPASLTIVAVSKGRAPEEIEEAVEAGITDIGENKVREAIAKFDFLRKLTNEKQVRWHMVGHLQTNKVKEAVKIFDLIHSVDSLHLAEEIDRHSAKADKIQDILAQVNVSAEASKFGFEPEAAPGAVRELSQFKNIRIRGLMAIAPIVGDSEEARPYFRRLRELRDEISRNMGSDLPILSMGMTDDFEAAIKEGANMLRIGRAIFDPGFRV